MTDEVTGHQIHQGATIEDYHAALDSLLSDHQRVVDGLTRLLAVSIAEIDRLRTANALLSTREQEP